MKREIEAWVVDRNQRQSEINWHGKTTESLLRWMESRPCVRRGRDTRIVETLCDRCRRQIAIAYSRERAETRDGQLRLY